MAVSGQNNVLVNNNNNAYVLSEADQVTLYACVKFANSLIAVVNELRTNNKATTKLEKFPKDDLQRILENTGSVPTKEPTGELEGVELSNYLSSHIQFITPEPPKGDDFPVNLVTYRDTVTVKIVPILKNNCERWKKNNVYNLSHSLLFGLHLDMAYHIWKKNRRQRGRCMTWSKWLEQNCKIKDSYARKLRDVAKRFISYRGLRLVGLPFEEIYRRRFSISEMLQDPNIAVLWR